MYLQLDNPSDSFFKISFSTFLKNLIVYNNETVKGEIHQDAIKIYSDVSSNTNYAIGYDVLKNITSGKYNTGIGNQSLSNNHLNHSSDIF